MVNWVSSSKTHVLPSCCSSVLNMSASSSVSQNGCHCSSYLLQLSQCPVEENSFFFVSPSRSKQAWRARSVLSTPCPSLV